MSRGGASLPPLPERLAGYRVVRRLSAGGMGEVLLASREAGHGFAKRVAIKTVLPHLTDKEDYRSMFFDEARLASRLNHPNVCQVFDFGEDAGRYFLVMEFVDGVSVEHLRDAHKEAGTCMPPELAALVVAQAARGLHHAHTLRGDDGELLGVVHRDVSPQNLLVTYSGATKVLDFGIAKSRERDNVTQMGVVRGKPGYMAPEQTVGDELDSRTDIFQLGIVLWELLTSRELFVRENIYASIRAVVEEPIPDVRGEVPGIPDGFSDVLQHALTRDPEGRFSNADAFARALDEVIGRTGRPVTEAALGDHVRALIPPPAHAEEVSGATSAAEGEERGKTEVSGRPEGARTAVMGTPSSGDNADAGTSAADDPAPAPLRVQTPKISSPGLTTGIAVLDRGRWRLWAAVGGAAAVALAVVSLAVGGGDAPPEAPRPSEAPADPPPEAPADAPPTEPTPTADPPADEAGAGPVADAPRRRGRRRGRAPRDPQPVEEPLETAPPVETSPAEDARAKATVVPAGAGWLTVVAARWAEVHVDGKRVGKTPLRNHKLVAGSHIVELIDPGTGAVRLKRTVEVKEGEQTRIKDKS
jgi:serine/threonine-protein kinase